MLAHLGFDPAALENRRTWSLSRGEKRWSSWWRPRRPGPAAGAGRADRGTRPGSPAALADLVGRRAGEAAS